VERYWEGEYPDVKVRYIPIMCQHCENAPCEPVCPVYATYHNNEGLNVQVYNRCVGTRYCANNCPYQVRFFNFWEPVWPDELRNQLNPDVTVRSRGIMEKCTFCVQRIRRSQIQIEGQEGQTLTEEIMRQRNLMPACVQACPTNALWFGDIAKENEKEFPTVAKLREDKRHYLLLEEIGTGPNVVYLKKVDKEAKEEKHA
jgi:molybdopterin-containing oxidoreductase family iron-sulfur binding subunit